MKCTIVSFVPWETTEFKPGMIPGDYVIHKSDAKTPSVLVVDESTISIYMGDGKTFPTPCPADKLAKSIVEDASKAYLEVSDDARPGLFFVEGVFTPDEILKKFPKECEIAKIKQNKWFTKLVKTADDSWARFHQHRMISDMQRIAAGILGLSSKEWAISPEPVSLMKCPACMEMIESTSIVCKNCRTVLKADKAKELGLQFVTQ